MAFIQQPEHIRAIDEFHCSAFYVATVRDIRRGNRPFGSGKTNPSLFERVKKGGNRPAFQHVSLAYSLFLRNSGCLIAVICGQKNRPIDDVWGGSVF